MAKAGATAVTMSSSITCRGHFHGDLASVSDSLSSVHHSCLAISTTSTPLGATPGPLSTLDIVSDKKTSNSAVEVTEIAVNECVSPSVSDFSESSANMSTDSRPSLSSRKAPSSSESRPTLKHIRTVPSVSSNTVTPAHRRSTSRSTVRSGQASRNSSLHSSRPTVIKTPTSPSVASRKIPPEKRENLIALHREACRIFQSDDSIRRNKLDNQLPHSPTSTVSNYFSPHDGNSPRDIGSPASSPVIRPQPSYSHLERESLDVSPRHTHQPSQFSSCDSNGTRSRKTSATVIDWTSPSTRRREYAKIDRASSGFRGLWRRVAPKWCQFANRRTPFFEEGKDGKANYEGSVRRFRMDIPEETDAEPAVDHRRYHFKVLRRKFSGAKAEEDNQNHSKKRRSWRCVQVT